MTDTERKKPIGVLLKEKGLITEAHVQFALQEQKVTKEKLGELLERLGFVTEHDVVTTLADQSGMEYFDVDNIIPEEAILKLFNKNLCINNVFLPLRRTQQSIDIAVCNVFNEKIAQLITRQSGLQPRFYISERTKIINAINKCYYFLENPVEKLIDNEVRILSQDKEMARGTDKLIEHILHLAVKMRATDIHIRPMKQSLNLSFRVDGVMTSVVSFPASLYRLVSSLKMKADMDIAEQRLPQDGRFTETILNNTYDFRASTIVSPEGENMVLRLLPLESAVMGMDELGFLPEHIEIVEKIFREPYGIILLTGPTGSGKSTTLYAGLRRLNLLEKNLVTVEEPIEYSIPLVRQTQVNEKAGYTFASAVRYFLRHDPDIILVGEIRDSETAATAVTAATTGHLVMSTLHTNSALGVIPRLKDLGVRPFLIADSLVGVVNQRLVRKICKACQTGYSPSEKEKAYLGDASITALRKGAGCEVCSGSGYFGRTLVYEILEVHKELALLIEQEADLRVIMEKIQQNGYVDMADTTITKVKQGITTAAEAMRTLGNMGH